jgi:hypothetical protein
MRWQMSSARYQDGVVDSGGLARTCQDHAQDQLVDVRAPAVELGREGETEGLGGGAGDRRTGERDLGAVAGEVHQLPLRAQGGYEGPVGAEPARQVGVDHRVPRLVAGLQDRPAPGGAPASDRGGGRRVARARRVARG